jgi:Mycobacterium membrane protein
MARRPNPGDQQQSGYPQQSQPPPDHQPQPDNEQQSRAGYPQSSGYTPMPGYPSPGYPSSGYPPPGWQPDKKRGGLATASLVLGIIGLVLAVIPGANFVAYPLVVLAIIFGLIAIRWGKAKAGLVLGIVGLVATIIWTVAIGTAVNDAVNRSHTVVYSVKGTIGTADISYYSSDSTNNDNQISTDRVPLPWSKAIKVKGDLSIFDVTANTHIALHSKSGTLSCTLSVDGKVVSRDSAHGDGNFVSCDGNGYSGN